VIVRHVDDVPSKPGTSKPGPRIRVRVKVGVRLRLRLGVRLTARKALKL